jgi:iron complex transport system substrate-binding protein
MIRHVLLTVLLGAALLGSACGADDPPGPSAVQGSSADALAAFPRTIEHKFGRTEVPAAPERVVTVGYTEQDVVLALGVTPVATRDFLGGYDAPKRPWAQRALGGRELPSVGGEQIDLEAVAAQRPDLIVALNTGMDRGEYERLSRIAPTIAQSGDVVDFGMSWQDQTRLVGRALGRDARAERVVRDVEARFARARREHPELVGATAVLSYVNGGTFGAYSSQDTRSRFFADLGMRTPRRVDRLAGRSFYTELSAEQFRLLDQDVVVHFGTREDVRRSPVLRRLRALREDRIVFLDLGDQLAGALGFSSPLSLPFLLDEAVPRLAAAVDGDPTTPVRQPE